jgi:fatty-acyl-CoA synthase
MNTAAPRSDTLPELIQELADRYGDAPALVDGERRYSYRELNAAVRDFAAGLQELGVCAGDRAALLMGNRAEWVISALGIAAAGAIMVGVNTWWTAREIAYALEHSGACTLVSATSYLRQDFARIIEELRGAGRLPQVERVIGLGDAMPTSWMAWADVRATGGQAQASRLPDASGEDVAFMLYTSGSTNRPKAVQLVHRSLIRNTWNIGERQRVTCDDRLWLAVSLFWGFGCSNAMLNLLTHGGCIVLQEAFDAAEALRLIEAHRCTMIYGTPNMVQALHEHPDRHRRDLSSLRGGATLGSPDQMLRAVELGARDLCNLYGLTETYGNTHHTDAMDPLELRLRSCGKPLPGNEQRIVDPESGRELPAGATGEIRVKGHVTVGYYRNPEQTALAFDEQGFFRTGDLGCVDAEGNLFFRGRLKEMVKTGGINVAPAEVEEVLMAHPDVQLAYVTGVPDAKRDEILAAVVVPRAGARLTEQQLRDYCRKELAAYKMPALVRFARESELPLTTTGKVHKDRLAREFFAPAAQTS